MALERLSSPEQLDQLVRVTTPVGWLALGAVAALLVTGIIWGLTGSIPTKVGGRGILIRAGGVNTIVSTTSGQIDEVLVSPGDVVEAGQVVATVTRFGRLVTTDITSPHSGRILEVAVNQGAVVNRGTQLFSLIDETKELEAIVYLSPADGKRVRPGMLVEVSPSTTRREEGGFMLGEVRSVGEFPATSQGMVRVLGNEDLVGELSEGGAPIEVHVALQEDEGTVSGYRWSTAAGPPVTISSGTLCSAAITISQERPISLVVPGS
ncbi:MAG TPA: NHLP bacteriocin system secretion protein [Ardenticatenaceae bacterium]|nr:NHLP bacteriocin system secretion protein [Ardenticatenaceae bacterium]